MDGDKMRGKAAAGCGDCWGPGEGVRRQQPEWMFYALLTTEDRPLAERGPLWELLWGKLERLGWIVKSRWEKRWPRKLPGQESAWDSLECSGHLPANPLPVWFQALSLLQPDSCGQGLVILVLPSCRLFQK